MFEETYVSGNEDGSLLAALGNVGCENDRGKQLAVTMKDPPAIDSQATPPIWASSPDGLPGISLRVMQLSGVGRVGGASGVSGGSCIDDDAVLTAGRTGWKTLWMSLFGGFD